ncbi:Splicing factor 3B subunit 3 [Coelomomyces lativittatus]|nr:Splicing factor 3B subunit 3 [Coelomomyces lativittatus]
MVVLKSGYLFVAAEFGNHHLYSIDDLGDGDEDQPEYTSADGLEGQFVYFRPRELKNLTLVDIIESTHPLMDAKVLNWNKEETPPMYTVCGRGAQSTFRVLRYGLEIAELAVTEVPAHPKAIWTTKLKAGDLYDAYIVVSFANATVVFAIGDTVEEIADSGFLGDVTTLLVKQMGEEDLIQVHPLGIRHIKSDKRTFEWKCPVDRTITCATANTRQLLLVLNQGELIYFELDAAGLLSEFPERKKMPVAVTCMDIGDVPMHRLRNRFVAVGSADNIVRILSLDPDSCMESLSMQALNATPESLCTIDMKDTALERGDAMYLYIGLQNGVLIRSTVDPTSGELLDSRLRFLGRQSPKLFRVRVAGENAMIALSTRTWLNYVFQGKTKMSPVNYDLLDYASSFASEQCPEGIVAVSRNTVRILMPDHLGKNFQQTSVELNYTPRKFVHHPLSHHFVLIESDQNTYTPSESETLLAAKAEEFQDDSVILFKEEFPESHYGLIKATRGKWASCLRLMNPFDGTSTQLIPLPNDEAAFSLCIVQFASQPQEFFLVVGTAVGLIYPNTFKEAYLLTYQFIHGGTQLEFLHRTSVEGLPLAMTGFQGKIAVGIGKLLRLYDLGKKKLLRKTENRQFNVCINGLHTQGNRLVVTDLQESVHFVMYRYQDNKMVVFADDVVPRWTTCSLLLDFDTVACGDRFGNVFILRLPKSISNEMEEDISGNSILYEKGFLNAAQHKLELISSFYIGDWITSITKTTLIPGGRELILYTTLGGLIGCLIPFTNKEDVDFFVMLEMHLRQEHDSLIGRDHMKFRSYYTPVKNVIDGDLCEQFLRLSQDKRDSIAQEMDRTALEINKKLEDFRTRVAF